MSNDNDLKYLEKKLWGSTYEDGFVDILLGALLILLGTTPFIERAIGRWYILILMLGPGIFGMTLIYFGKKHITTPRIGMAKFGAERQARQRKSLRLSIISLIVLVILVGLTATQRFSAVFGVSLSGYKVPLIIAVGVFVLISFKARLLGIPRLELYGFVLGSCVIATEILRNLVARPWHNVISWGAPGLIILFYGLRRLMLFMRKYPVPHGGEHYHEVS